MTSNGAPRLRALTWPCLTALLGGCLLLASCAPKNAPSPRERKPGLTRRKFVDFGNARALIAIGRHRLARFDLDGTVTLLGADNLRIVERVANAPANPLYILAAPLRGLAIDDGGWLWRVEWGSGRPWRKALPKALFRAVTHATIGPDGALYTIEGDGKMYRTDLSSGRSAPFGNPGWERTRHFFHCGPFLFTIEKIGALYRVVPQTGRWQRTGPFGAYSRVRHALCVEGSVITLESDSSVYLTSIPAGKRRRLLQHPVVLDTNQVTAVGRTLLLVNGRGRLLRLALPR